MGSVNVSSCRCCMFVLCMPCNLLMLVKDARGAHMKEVCSRTGLMTALYVAMGVSLCLPQPVAVTDFIICRGL